MVFLFKCHFIHLTPFLIPMCPRACVGGINLRWFDLQLFGHLQEPGWTDWPVRGRLPCSRPTQGGDGGGWSSVAQLRWPFRLLQEVHGAVLPTEHRGANDRPHNYLPEILERVRLEDPLWKPAEVRRADYLCCLLSKRHPVVKVNRRREQKGRHEHDMVTGCWTDTNCSADIFKTTKKNIVNILQPVHVSREISAPQINEQNSESNSWSQLMQCTNKKHELLTPWEQHSTNSYLLLELKLCLCSHRNQRTFSHGFTHINLAAGSSVFILPKQPECLIPRVCVCVCVQLASYWTHHSPETRVIFLSSLLFPSPLLFSHPVSNQEQIEVDDELAYINAPLFIPPEAAALLLALISGPPQCAAVNQAMLNISFAFDVDTRQLLTPEILLERFKDISICETATLQQSAL